MFYHHWQRLEILLKCLRLAHFNGISTIFLKILNIYFVR